MPELLAFLMACIHMQPLPPPQHANVDVTVIQGPHTVSPWQMTPQWGFKWMGYQTGTYCQNVGGHLYSC